MGGGLTRGETGVKVGEAALYNLDAREDTLQRVLAVNTHGSSLPFRAAWRMFPFSCDEKGLCVMGTQRPFDVYVGFGCYHSFSNWSIEMISRSSSLSVSRS